MRSTYGTSAAPVTSSPAEVGAAIAAAVTATRPAVPPFARLSLTLADAARRQRSTNA